MGEMCWKNLTKYGCGKNPKTESERPAYLYYNLRNLKSELPK